MKIKISGILLEANKVDSNGRVFTEEALKNAAEKWNNKSQENKTKLFICGVDIAKDKNVQAINIGFIGGSNKGKGLEFVHNYEHQIKDVVIVDNKTDAFEAQIKAIAKHFEIKPSIIFPKFSKGEITLMKKLSGKSRKPKVMNRKESLLHLNILKNLQINKKH